MNTESLEQQIKDRNNVITRKRKEIEILERQLRNNLRGVTLPNQPETVHEYLDSNLVASKTFVLSEAKYGFKPIKKEWDSDTKYQPVLRQKEVKASRTSVSPVKSRYQSPTRSGQNPNTLKRQESSKQPLKRSSTIDMIQRQKAPKRPQTAMKAQKGPVSKSDIIKLNQGEQPPQVQLIMEAAAIICTNQKQPSTATVKECFRNYEQLLQQIRKAGGCQHVKQAAKKIAQFEKMGLSAGNAQSLLNWVNTFVSQLTPSAPTKKYKVTKVAQKKSQQPEYKYEPQQPLQFVMKSDFVNERIKASPPKLIQSVSCQKHIDVVTAELQDEFQKLKEQRGGVSNEEYKKVQDKNEKARDEFFKAMADFYDPKVMKRHESPTTRLIQQKNSAWNHKEILSTEVPRTQEYGIDYTTSPGRSYIIEPIEGRLDYTIAYKDPIKFYDLVMEQQVQQHQITDTQSGQEITSSLTKRKIGMILKDVQTKLTELVWMEPEEKEGLQEIAETTD